MPEPLNVWFDDRLVAQLVAGRQRGQVMCQYATETIDRIPGGVPLLSCSLPVSARRLDASAFCRGLLPEGRHLDAMAREAGVPSNDTFGLLARFGANVAGALVIGRVGPDRRDADVEPYSPATLADEVAGLAEHPLALHDDSELSIAGLQDKLLLVALPEGGWGRPRHGYPSTHILKTDDPRRPGLIDAEAACLRLAVHVGLGDLVPQLTEVAGVSCLIVARFDRTVDDAGVVRRLHQEDACQALGVDIDAHRGRGKYERHGGPSWVAIAELLDAWAASPWMPSTISCGSSPSPWSPPTPTRTARTSHCCIPSPGSLPSRPPTTPCPPPCGRGCGRRRPCASVASEPMDAITLEHVVAEAASWPQAATRVRRVATATCEQLRDAAHGGVAGHQQVTDLVSRRATALLDGRPAGDR